MASLYKKNNVYYLSVKLNGKRKAKSLHTEKLSAAKKLQPLVEFELLKELHGFNKKQEQITFKELISLYLKLITIGQKRPLSILITSLKAGLKTMVSFQITRLVLTHLNDG